MAVETEQGVHPGYGFGSMSSLHMFSDMHTEPMDDYDGSLANKMGGRSGRRKQNKPIRVFMDTDPLEGELEAPVPAPNPRDAETSSPAVDKPSTETASQFGINCDLCMKSFETQSALTDHIQSVHEIDNSDNPDDFPTKYHQLGSEFRHEATSLAAMEEGQPRSHTLPKPAFYNGSECNSPGGSGGSGSKKIFHQDAFCELCDREFCNRYFLKTHKANKHGVFDSSPCESPSNRTVPALIPLKMDGEDLRASSSSSPKEASVSSGQSKQSTSTPPAPSKPKENPTSLPSSSKPTSVAASIPPLPSALEKRASFDKPSPDMEDYCELCQKHFCNKYYLKKHKQDVHGIVPEDTPGAKRARPSHGNSPMSMSAVSTNPLLLPHTASPLTSSAVNGNGAIPGLSSMANVMFINPFGPPLALFQSQQLNPAGFPPHLSGLPQLPQALHEAESPKTSLPSSSSPAGVFPLPPDPFRLMGGEVVCEICKKEFCNKYFLKLHKANKHGISSDDLPSSLPLMLPGLPGLPQNLTLQDPSGKELGELPVKKEQSCPNSPDDKKSKQNHVETCDICKKEFPNQYSLKIHIVNTHNQRLPEFDLLPELSKAENLSAGILGNCMFNNMMAAKLADRVMCDICNKEVCNKYFLKTHKIKVHGVDPVQAENELNMQPLNMSKPPMSSPSHMPFLSGMPQKEVPIPPPSEPITRPSDSELLKMGIDPEAYCEICKKEFCSKYFLKTHKWNLHGIKTEGTPPSGARTKERTETSSSSKASSSGSGGRRNWKWKEPANSMRVMCELCNKELCNKYFLKTHMLNKHGINIDVSAGSPGFPAASIKPNPGMANPPMPAFPLPPFPFPGFIKDENSNTGMVPTSSSENGITEPKKAEPAEADKFSNKMECASTETQACDVPAEPQCSPNVLSAKTWPVPETKPHMTDMDGAINLSSSAKSKVSYPVKDDGPEEKRHKPEPTYTVQKCNVCGMTFAEKQSLHLHMMHEHEEASPSGKQSDMPEDLSCQRNSSITNLGLSLRRKYQFGVRRKAHHMQKLKRLGGGVSIAEKVKSAIVNHIQNHLKKKKFKCAFCHEKFSLRSLCQQHIRSKHKRETSGSGEASGGSPMKTGLVSREIGTKILPGPEPTMMQPFTVEEKADGGHFARSVVYLPVYSKISEPLSVTFNLTPAEH